MSGGKEPKFEATADSHIGPWVQLAVSSYNKEGMVQGWSKNAGVLSMIRFGNAETFFPCPLSHTVVAEIIHAWLDAIDYPVPPSTDGSVKKGWTIRTIVAGFEVEPAWVVYSK